ncbi:hypothetical protein CASFOL_042261 [Castilleja foliolosa]|uniref:DNA helicase Pif1-like 2B domain-containing protein n=1 Tax=Castilleja foliolosa TaxID=1961234 RepID=A0ABD3BA23_9LAMI
MDASEFASWLLRIGDGLLGEPDINDPDNTRRIQIPPQYLIETTENKLQSLIYFIYDRSTLNNPSPDTLSTRAIVCPTNDTSDEINKLVLTLIPGECKVYNSHDVMIPHGVSHSDLEALYPQEYLNQLSFPGIPLHELTLKINTPIILIRNINQTLGLCNGTRLIVSQLLPRIIEAQIIIGTSIGSEQQKPRTIEIRVLRKWISKGKKEELCYQFVDTYLESCYKVSGYICVGARTYMATVEHVASLVIRQKARFEPVTNLDIPITYFNFATYETIQKRIKDTKFLTDYIGRVKNNSLRSTSTGKQLRKTPLQDEMGKEIEITLWPEMRHLIGDDVIPGDIVAIASTMVTEHNGLLQLESTYLTTTTVNPDMTQTVEHVNRLRALPAMQLTGTHEKTVTLLDLRLSIQENIQWYCVNATITDATGSADVVFFDEGMQGLLNISCKDMVTKHAHTKNPKIVPQLIRSATDTPRLLHLTLKNDGKIVVNNVSEGKTTNDNQSTSTGASMFTPTTPLPKKGTPKRQLAETPG